MVKFGLQHLCQAAPASSEDCSLREDLNSSAHTLTKTQTYTYLKKKAIYLFRVLVIKSNLTSEALIAIMKGSEYSKSSKIDKAIKV